MYLYKFLDKYGKILYIGKTDALKKRFYQHKKDKYWWKYVKRIEFALINKNLVDIYERYYINFYNTIYNKKDTKIKYKEFNLKLLEWSEFDEGFI